MNDIVFLSTEEARTWCQPLATGATYYKSLVSELQNAKTQISQNWEGDTADIADILARIDTVTSTFETKVIPALEELSSTVVSFADAVDQVASGDANNGATTAPTVDGTNSGTNTGGSTIPGSTGTGTAGTTGTNTSTENEKPGFWEYHGNNFADAWTNQAWGDAWDYSNVDGVFSAVGTTVDAVLDTAGNIVDAVVDTAGATVNFVLDGAANLVGWLFD